MQCPRKVVLDQIYRPVCLGVLHYRVEDLEVLDGLEGLEHGLQLGHDVQLGGVAVVLDERPELLQAVQLARVGVADCLLLKEIGLVAYLTKEAGGGILVTLGV